jgi:uncharacterized protein YhjY with autotransporter beta-barrel domain
MSTSAVLRAHRPWAGGAFASACAAVAISGSIPQTGVAQTREFGPGLVGLPYSNAIEQAAADANQAVFDAFEPRCNPDGQLNQIPDPQGPPPGSNCGGDQFFAYLVARELVHTANELRGQGGPTVASLGLDQEGLGLALRWTAAEEFAAQGSMATEFANGQLSNLAARMSALRYGAGGFGITNLHDPGGQIELFAGGGGRRGGGAAADDATGETYSPWGGFLNYSFGYGEKGPTSLEDAFDFDGSEVTLGVDYRFPSNLVLGGIVGFSEQAIDFDEAASAISVVDGTMESDATSVIAFALYQAERLNLSGSIGWQAIDYDVSRDIKYPSFNPDTESVYSVANSHPEADATTATFGVGYAMTFEKFTFEPYFNAEYLDLTVDAFSEERSINLLSNADVSHRFDLRVSEQKIESLDLSAGLRFQYVFTPRLGVIVPYLSIEAHRELDDDARTITSGYTVLEDVLGTSTFVLPTDARDDSYQTVTAGFSIVLRGGRQREADGPIAGGLSGFFQVKTVQKLANYDDSVITGGFRYEF